MRKRDLTGQRFGRLVALDSQSVRDSSGRARVHWRCQCDCGSVVTVDSDPITRGVTASCGCLRKEVTATRSTTHGAKVGRIATPEYKAWLHAKGRCYTTTDKKFPLYGGRGIRMCDRWREDFTAFLADVGLRPPGRSLDRIDVNGHYEPGNCRWATPRQQANNTRVNIRVDLAGNSVTLKQAAAAFDVDYKSLHFQVRTKGRDATATLRDMARRKHRT
jgi:hypothetical protein